MNKRPGNIDRRFPLYDFTRYLTNMRNLNAPSTSFFDNIYKAKVVKFTNIESSKTLGTNIFNQHQVQTTSINRIISSSRTSKVYDYGKLTFAINIEFCQHQYIINSQIHESYILINTRNRHVSSKASYDNIENNEILAPKSMRF
jgi:hypothetical protein